MSEHGEENHKRCCKKNTGSADVPTALELERHSIDHSLFHTQEIGPFVLRH